MIHDGKIAFDVTNGKYAFRIHAHIAFIFVAIIFSACGQLERPKTEPFYSQTEPPRRQEFRWSNGRAPKTIDPARASAPSETDVVRAIYEGLTDLDPRTLSEIPGVAEKWESSADLRTWTFHLRKDSRWSNGEAVVADDFVRSWKRLAELKAQSGNTVLIANIVGMKGTNAQPSSKPEEPTDFLRDPALPPQAPLQRMQAGTNTAANQPPARPQAQTVPESSPKTALSDFGVEAIDDRTLRVKLVLPDKDFPKLVASPIFRPIYGDGAELEQPGLDAGTVSNGAFRIVSIADNSISLERSETYWDRRSVDLERVRLIATDTAEKALEAYKAGSVDVVSNADFEPLALKLLTPYEDFRKTTHSALNYYEINPKAAPFSDRRVRAALAISIDRERLSEAQLDGSTQPAYSYLPLGETGGSALFLDIERAKDLLAKAGYPNGENFPQIRLVVNRNDTQQRVARTVAKMWRQNLNLDTIVVVKESSEMDKTRESGDFDLIRRGVVMPTVDELVCLSLVFGSPDVLAEQAIQHRPIPEDAAAMRREKDLSTPGRKPGSAEPDAKHGGPGVADQQSPAEGLSEEESLFNIYAIPLYFPTSYALVKPYVRGFDINGLDAPLLKDVAIDNGWQPKGPSSESN